MTAKEELLRRATYYAQSHGITLRESLGSGIHGIVFVAQSHTNPGRSAVKIHEREAPYCRERDVYLRLREYDVTRIHGCSVPQLLQFDDALWGIEMSVVGRPYVLDFAGAYLDNLPDYSPEVINEWRTEKQEQFGDRWTDVEAILSSLKRYGIYLVDVSPSNIAFSD